MRTFTFKITTHSGIPVRITLAANDLKEAERKLWQKIVAEGLDATCDLATATIEKGLPQ